MFLVDLYLICNSVLSEIYICASQSRDHKYFAHERLMCIRCQCDGILLTYVQDIRLGSMP